MDNVSDLELLLRSHHPLLVAPIADEERFLDVVRTAAATAGADVWLWSVTKGLRRDGMEPMYGTRPIVSALDFISERDDAPSVYVIADAASQIADAVVVRRLKEVTAELGVGSTIILSGAGIEPPPELQTAAHVWRLRPPDAAELRELVARTLRHLADRGMVVAIGPDDLDDVVASVSGLSTGQAERLIQRIALDDGTIDVSDLDTLGRARAEILAGDGVLELVESRSGTLDDVGGLDLLKEWLAVRRRALDTAAAGIDPLRGILLTGVPGAGKSFVAKAIAATWNRPLLLLDPGRLYAKYLGESEERLRRALDSVDAMAPAVLWIDEIEKGFARHGDGDGGASARVLGTFLRWLQERSSDVFVVATANDVSSLPPELARKGRFDEVFFVDLPGPEARAAILAIHLGRREFDPAAVDLPALVAATEGYTGAEIEAAIVAARYRVAGGDAGSVGDLIASEVSTTIPLSRARAEDVTRLRDWAATRAVSAG